MGNDSIWDSTKAERLSLQEIDRDFRLVMRKAGKLERRQASKGGRNVLFIAASFATVILTISLYYLKSKPEQIQYPEMRQYCTSAGEIKDFTLPDGSKVVLNSGSVLICPDKFGENRSVFLLGEAVFDVSASKESPFLVKTSGICVRVHGTRFNVKAYQDDPEIRTTLCRGAVEVWPNERQEQLISLEPGESVSYDREDGSMSVNKVIPSESTAWESGDLSFRSESIFDVIRTLERKFNVEVILTSNRYNDAVITAHFIHGENLEETVKAISAIVPGMKFNIEDGKVYLR